MKYSYLKSFLLILWNGIFNFSVKISKGFYRLFDKIFCLFYSPPVVMSIQDSIDHIINHHCSVARYGDGEMKLIMNHNISFQKFDNILKIRLKQILSNNNSNLIVCIPNIFSSLDIYAEHDRKFWREYLSCSRKTWYQLLDNKKVYFDAFVSRCYLPYKDKKKSGLLFQMWKRLWNDRDVLIIEGEKTRFGVGNDLLDNAKSVQRVLGPVKNAFDFYDELLDEAKKQKKDTLILIALGPTATVLAADLSATGYQAIDIGHLDIEYEWFLKHVDHKVQIDGKYVNEAGGFSGSETNVNQEYQSQIVKVID